MYDIYMLLFTVIGCPVLCFGIALFGVYADRRWPIKPANRERRALRPMENLIRTLRRD